PEPAQPGWKHRSRISETLGHVHRNPQTKLNPELKNAVYDELEKDLLDKFDSEIYEIRNIDFNTYELKYFIEHKVSAIIYRKDGIYGEDYREFNILGRAATEEIRQHRRHIHYVKTVTEKKPRRH
ncbi:hypothetical protein, partial [Pseudomonas sp. FSL R10-2398]|uniref:hypothetical protein n=1 Tax=Pseudomonas sp. FSL R10-2398 TaxID=2662201 RepID=UPI0015B43771